jgi:Spy/CpxP family protein refolding chaperone
MDTTRIAKAIGVLHDTLNAAQRKELVEKVTAKMEKFGGPEGRPDGKDRGPKGDADRRETKGDRGPKGERGDHGPKGERGDHGAGMHGPLGYLLRGIDLTDAQRETVRAAMEKTAPSEADRAAMKASHEAMRTAMKDRLATFASDSFDANAFVTPPAGAPAMGPEAMFGQMVKVIAAVTPVLDEKQRAELAKRIEEAPMGAPHMGKGHHHGPQQDDGE